MEKLDIEYAEGKNLIREMHIQPFIDFINKYSDFDYEQYASSNIETLKQINQIIKIIGNRKIAESVLRILNYNEEFLIKNSIYKPLEYEKIKWLLEYCMFGREANKPATEKSKKIDCLIFIISYLRNHPERLHYYSFNQYKKEGTDDPIDIKSNNTKEIQNEILDEQKAIKKTKEMVDAFERIVAYNKTAKGKFKEIQIKYFIDSNDGKSKTNSITIMNKEAISYVLSYIKEYLNKFRNPEMEELVSDSRNYTNNDVIDHIRNINKNLINKFDPKHPQQFTYVFWCLTGLENENFDVSELQIKPIDSRVFYELFSEYKSFTKKIMRS